MIPVNGMCLQGKDGSVGKTAVVIPNYNGIKYLADCLNSLKTQSLQGFNVIVVDDCSTDDSIKEIECNFPEVTCVKRDKNGGFSVAVNEGIRHAKDKGAEFVILLNNDAVAEKTFVENLVSAIEEDERIFSVQAKMLSLKEPDVIDDAGDFYTVLGWAYARGKGKSALKYTKKSKIFASCAGAAIYRVSVFEEIGMFDEAHFAYLEDIDLGYRALLYGYNNILEPCAIAYHAGSGTSGSRYNEFKIKLAARNNVYLIYKNETAMQRLFHFVPHLVGFTIKQLFFSKKGFGKIYHNAVLEGWQMCRTNEAKAKRKYLKKIKIKNFLKMEITLWLNVIRKIL